MALHIDIWSDIACPWCYIGKRRLERALADFPHRDEVEIRWRSYLLDPALPERYEGSEVDYLVERKGMPAEQVRQMMDHVVQQAAGEGLTYDMDGLVVASSRRAHRLIHLGARHGVAGELKEALLRAHFVEGGDISDVELLVRTGVAAGLAEEQVRAGLDDPDLGAAVEADIEAARSIGVSGVPFVVVGERYAVAGAQPPEVFAEALQRAWDEARPLTVVGDADASCGPEGCSL